MAIGANNLLMLALSNYRRKLFDLQTFQNQAHIISVTGIIIYFLGTYYLYTPIHLPQGFRMPKEKNQYFQFHTKQFRTMSFTNCFVNNFPKHNFHYEVWGIHQSIVFVLDRDVVIKGIRENFQTRSKSGNMTLGVLVKALMMNEENWW